MARNQVDIVLFAVSDPGWHFIGLKDMVGNNKISDHKWIRDGSGLSYQNWAYRQPKYSFERCVKMRINGQWDDGSCNACRESVCEFDSITMVGFTLI